MNEAIECYLKRVHSLLASIEAWSSVLGLTVTHTKTSIHEERNGRYDAPSLRLERKPGDRLAEVIPFGEAIIGALGRVDIVGHDGKREKIVYLAEGGPVLTSRIVTGTGDAHEENASRLYRGVDGEGWYWVSPYPIRRAYRMDAPVFGDLLSAVTDDEFRSSAI